MTLLKINRGKESALPKYYNDGWIYFCTDTGSFLIDHENPLNNNLITRTKINADHADKIYYTQNEEPPESVPDDTLWIDMDEEIFPILKIKKNGEWITINSTENKANKEHFHKTSDITEGILNIEQGGTNYNSMYDIQSESSAILRYRPSGLVPQETYPTQNQNGAIYWMYE